MAKSEIRNPKFESGYTLLEVLVASTIFVGVLMIGTASFATANRLRERTLAAQETTETARFVAETIAREVRAATGKKSENGSWSLVPFLMLKGGAYQTQLDCTAANGADGLRLYRFDATATATGQIVTRTYQFSTQNGGQLTFQEDSGTVTSLVPAGYTVTNGRFCGVTHALSGLRSQPFIQFQFTVTEVVTGNSQTIRTSVTSRELQ